MSQLQTLTSQALQPLQRSLSPSHRGAPNVGQAERVASIIAGGALLGWGLSRAKLISVPSALLGGSLLYRGFGGHCPMYGALGVDTARHQHAARDTRRAVTIQRTAEEIYAALAEPTQLARLFSHFADVEPDGADHLRWTLHDPLGGAHVWRTRIDADEASRSVRFESTAESPLVSHGELTLRQAEGDRGTEVVLRLHVEAPLGGRLGKLLAKLLSAGPTLIAQRALYNLKCLLEAGERPSLAHNPAARSSAAE